MDSSAKIGPRATFHAAACTSRRRVKSEKSRVIQSRQWCQISGHEEKLTVLRTVENCDSALSQSIVNNDPFIIGNGVMHAFYTSAVAGYHRSLLTWKAIKILPRVFQREIAAKNGLVVPRVASRLLRVAL